MSLNKTDLAFKKLINRQFTTPNRAFYQEVGANTLEIDSGMIYTSTISSSRASAISSSIVKLMQCVLTKDYSGTVSTSSYYVISGSGYSVNASNYNANFTSLGANFFSISSSYVQRNFLSEKYGTQYAVEIRNSSGTQLSPDSSINWYFDYKSGVLHVADPSLSYQPYSITASQYIGSFLNDTSDDANVGTPEMYGALGDGITDDFLAFKHALISHSIVELGAKTYAVRGWIGMPSYRSLVGKGKDRSVIKLMNNSPYGYAGQLYVIQNTVLQNNVNWTGSVVGTTDGTGSVVIDYRDTTVRDESPESPLYRQTQIQPWAGLGYWQYDTSAPKIGARKNVLIEGITVDCNFDRQARHASYNHTDNPYSASKSPGTGYYIPAYAKRVRSTVHAIVLNGENIVLKDVKVINYGYGCDAAAAGPLNYANSATLPPYNENFPLLINADIGLNYTSSDFNIGSDGVGLSRYRGNYAIGCEVLNIASTDLMNPFSNTTAIYVTNQAINNSSGRSSFSSEGGIFDCIVDPGERIKTPSASFWSGSYLDGFVSSSLKQTSANLAEWLYSTPGSLTGSNGDIAISYGSPGGAYTIHMKKVSGSWYAHGSGYSLQEHNVLGFSGYRMSRCLARNLEIGFYLDSWRNNVFLDNNQMVDVTSGFRYVVSDTSLTSSYKNVIIKDNYIKLSPHERTYISGHGVIDYSTGVSYGSGSILRHIDNLVIEDNIFELPISSSSNVYGTGNYVVREYPRHVGFWFVTEVTPNGSLPSVHRAVSIKNNKFFNWNPPKAAFTSAGEAYGYNIPFYFTFSTGSFGMDASDPAAGPYPLSVEKFKNQVLPNYIIEDNTYSDSNYPSTSSLVPITIQITGTGTNYFYPIDQVNRFATVKANSITSTTASIRLLNATGSLQGSSSYSLTSSYLIDGSSYQPWNTGSLQILLDGSGILLDEYGNPISEEGFGSSINYTGNVSIGTAGSDVGYDLYVSRSVKIGGELSQGFNVTASGDYSHAEGNTTVASGKYSHAEGISTYAFADGSHAEGMGTTSTGQSSHAEGISTTASGEYSHAEGQGSKSIGFGSHAEGLISLSHGQHSHAEGYYTTASGQFAHSEGALTSASAYASHAEGLITIASDEGSHAEGLLTVAFGAISHTEGEKTRASGRASHAEGYLTTGSGDYSHAEGNTTVASGQASHAEGILTVSSGQYSHAEGNSTLSTGTAAHAEGNGTFSVGNYSHTEGSLTTASTFASHAEGHYSIASGLFSHAEGSGSYAGFLSGIPFPIAHASHAEGLFTRTSGVGSHSEGSGSLASGVASHAEGNNTLASGETSHTEGYNTAASGWFSHAEGNRTSASGQGAHAEGEGTIASATSAHAEGYYTIASFSVAHAEGNRTTASAAGAHAEGDSTVAGGNYAHSEGYGNVAYGIVSHAEGVLTLASGDGAHSEGRYTTASGDYAHSEGSGSIASGRASHAEGLFTRTSETGSHSEGFFTLASGQYSHAEGNSSTASGERSHAEGNRSVSSGGFSHAEGYLTLASGYHSHAEGNQTTASGDNSHAAGYATKALFEFSHAEGYMTNASRRASHAEGTSTNASGDYSHAEGSSTEAIGQASHAEGTSTNASGAYSHAEGNSTSASGDYSHAEGESTKASGQASHAEGYFTTASADYQHVSGKFNVTSSNTDDLFIIGSGTDMTCRSNIMVVNRKTVYLNNGGYASGSGFNITSGSALCVNTTESFYDRTYFSASLSVAGAVIIKNGILLITGSESNGGGNNAASLNVKGCLDAPFLTITSKRDGPASTQKYGMVNASGTRLWMSAGSSAGVICIGDDSESNSVSIGTNPNSSYTLNIGTGVGSHALRVQGSISASGLTINGNISSSGFINALGVTSSVSTGVGFSGYMPSEFMVAVSDEISNLSSGSNKLRFIFPFSMTGSSIVSYVHTAPIGSYITSSARLAGGITISSSISSSAISSSTNQLYFIEKYQEVSVDVNQVGSSTAGMGLKLIFNGIRKI